PRTFGVLTRDDVADFTQAIRTSFPKKPASADSPEDAGIRLFGPAPTIEVEGVRTVAGVVRDAKTGAAIPGVRMVLLSGKSYGASDYTDRNGRYRFVRGAGAPFFASSARPRDGVQ